MTFKRDKKGQNVIKNVFARYIMLVICTSISTKEIKELWQTVSLRRVAKNDAK
jgi:hypothetical protein